MGAMGPGFPCLDDNGRPYGSMTVMDTIEMDGISYLGMPALSLDVN